MKKTIIISESQYLRLFEGHLDFNDGDIKEYGADEVTVTNNISDSNGEPQYGLPTLGGSDVLANDETPQNYWLNGAKFHNP